jgi:hypothetical protein
MFSLNLLFPLFSPSGILLPEILPFEGTYKKPFPLCLRFARIQLFDRVSGILRETEIPGNPGRINRVL